MDFNGTQPTAEIPDELTTTDINATDNLGVLGKYRFPTDPPIAPNQVILSTGNVGSLGENLTEWGTEGAGNVVGPVSSLGNEIAVYGDLSGTVITNSGILTTDLLTNELNNSLNDATPFNLQFQKSRAGTKVLLGDELGNLSYNGFQTTAGDYELTAEIKVEASEDFDNSNGSNVVITTTANGATVPTTAMIISSENELLMNGDIKVLGSTLETPNIHITSGAGLWSINTVSSSLNLEQSDDLAKLQLVDGQMFHYRGNGGVIYASYGSGIGGTLTTPNTPLDTNQMSINYANAYDGSNYKTASQITTACTQDWSVGANGASYSIATTDDNMTSPTQKVLVNTAGITMKSPLILEDKYSMIGGTTNWDILVNGDDLEFIPEGDKAHYLLEDKGPVIHTAVNGGTAYLSQASNGTISSPLPTLNGDIIHHHFNSGYFDGNYHTASQFRTKSTEDWATNSYGSSLELRTCDDNASSATTKIMINTAGVNIKTPLILGDGATDITFPTIRGNSEDVLKLDASGLLTFQPSVNHTTQSTGVLTGALLSINVDDTKFDISDGTGVFSPNGVTTLTEWSGLTAQSLTYVGALTYVYLAPGNIVIGSATAPNGSDIRDNIFIGVLGHPNGVNITSLSSEPMYLGNATNQIKDVAEAIGIISTSGNIVSPATLLTFQKSAGSIFSYASNYAIDVKNPHNSQVSSWDSSIADTFFLVYQDSSIASGQTSLIPAQYDNGGGVGSPGVVGSQEWATFRVFISRDQVFVQPGQVVYNKLADAQAKLFTESFVESAGIAENTVLISYIIVRGAGSDLNLASDALFVAASRLGGGGGGGQTNGDVIGPVSSENNGICRFDGTSGKLIKDSSTATVSNIGELFAPVVSTDLLNLNSASVVEAKISTNFSGNVNYNNSADENWLVSSEPKYKHFSGSNSTIGIFDEWNKSRGSISSPLGILTSDNIGETHYNGYNTVGYGTGSIVFVTATADWTPTSQPTSWGLYTTNEGATLASSKLRADTSGVTITDDLTINGVVTYPMPWGEMFFEDNATATVITDANWTKVLGTTTLNTSVQNFTMATNQRLTYTGATTKQFHCGVSFSFASSSNNNVNWKIGLGKNGTHQIGSQISRFTTTSGAFGSSAIHKIVELATNDYIELYVENDTNNDNCTFSDLNVFAMAMPNNVP